MIKRAAAIGGLVLTVALAAIVVIAIWPQNAGNVDTLSPSGAFSSSLFDSVKASVAFSLLTTIAITPIGVGAALLLNGPMRGRAVFVNPLCGRVERTFEGRFGSR